jgi:hypothetical protein
MLKICGLVGRDECAKLGPTTAIRGEIEAGSEEWRVGAVRRGGGRAQADGRGVPEVRSVCIGQLTSTNSNPGGDTEPRNGRVQVVNMGT